MALRQEFVNFAALQTLIMGKRDECPEQKLRIPYSGSRVMNKYE
jgi:hypothetical protein